MNKRDEAKATWAAAGLNEQGVAAIHQWIDELYSHIEAAPGRWAAYERFARYEGSDPMGSVSLLNSAVKETAKA